MLGIGLFGGAGNDLVGGGYHSDRILGGPGNDVLFGNEGKDSVDGARGYDVCLDWETTVAGCESSLAGAT